MLSLYSDASLLDKTKPVVAATIILGDDDRFYAYIINVYAGIKSSVHAELLGVAQGLEWVCKNAPDEEVRVVCDNEPVVERLANYPGDKKVADNVTASTWLRVFSMLDLLKPIQVAHIKAHQQHLNPNQVCDMVCSRLIRQVDRGVI